MGVGVPVAAEGLLSQQGRLGLGAPAPFLLLWQLSPHEVSGMEVLQLSLLRARKTGKNHSKLQEQNK